MREKESSFVEKLFLAACAATSHAEVNNCPQFDTAGKRTAFFLLTEFDPAAAD